MLGSALKELVYIYRVSGCDLEVTKVATEVIIEKSVFLTLKKAKSWGWLLKK